VQRLAAISIVPKFTKREKKARGGKWRGLKGKKKKKKKGGGGGELEKEKRAENGKFFGGGGNLPSLPAKGTICYPS
jgi:hypothetical protein